MSSIQGDETRTQQSDAQQSDANENRASTQDAEAISSSSSDEVLLMCYAWKPDSKPISLVSYLTPPSLLSDLARARYVHVCICIYIYIYVFIYAWMYISVYVCIDMYVYMCVCIYIYIYEFICMHVCVYIYEVYMYMFTWIHMHICVCVSTHSVYLWIPPEGGVQEAQTLPYSVSSCLYEEPMCVCVPGGGRGNTAAMGKGGIGAGGVSLVEVRAGSSQTLGATNGRPCQHALETNQGLVMHIFTRLRTKY